MPCALRPSPLSETEVRAEKGVSFFQRSIVVSVALEMALVYFSHHNIAFFSDVGKCGGSVTDSANAYAE